MSHKRGIEYCNRYHRLLEDFPMFFKDKEKYKDCKNYCSDCENLVEVIREGG